MKPEELDELGRLYKSCNDGYVSAAVFDATSYHAFPDLLALARDGVRYRWLRSKAFTEDRDGGYVKYYVFPFVCYANGADYKGHKPYYHKTLDAAIDAAMKERT